MISSGWMHDGTSLFSLRDPIFSLARRWGSGGKTDVNLNAVNGYQHIVNLDEIELQ